MDFADIMLSEISQTMINTVRAHLYVESKKQNKETKKMKIYSQIQRTNGWLPEGRGMGY